MIVAHLSDLHLGGKSLGDPHGAERLNSLRQAIIRLGRESPQAILIAGDVFDSPHVDRAVIQEAARTLDKAKDEHGEPIPVVLIPGNHDPSDADFLWSTFRYSLGPASLLHLVLSPGVVPLADGRLLIEAYPCETRYSAEAPWAKRLDFAGESAGAVRVVLAHGTLQGGPVPEGESDAYPFTPAEVEELGADYVALGHFHRVYPPWRGGKEVERSICYCGTHEQTEFGGDSGYVIIATLVKGKPALLRRMEVGRRRWQQVEITDPADLQKLEDVRKEVENDADPAHFVIRVKFGVTTRFSPEQGEKVDAILDGLRALGAQAERHGEYQTLLDVTTLELGTLPSGAVKEAILSLQAEFAQVQDDRQRQVISAALHLGWARFKETR